MVAGVMPPSQLLRKFAAHPYQHDLAIAPREIGRIERTLFIIDWLLDADMQRRAQIGLNKGEAHHALKMPCVSDGRGKLGCHSAPYPKRPFVELLVYWK